MVRFFTVQSSGFAKFRLSLCCRMILISAFFLILPRDWKGFQLRSKEIRVCFGFALLGSLIS